MSRHGKIAANKTLLVVNIDKEMKAALKALAKKSNRSLSNFVVTELLRAAAAAAEPKKSRPKFPGQQNRQPPWGQLIAFPGPPKCEATAGKKVDDIPGQLGKIMEL